MAARQPVTYCSNIHPGESWEQVRANIEAHVPAVKRAVCPHVPFPVGLRMPGRASRELTDQEARDFRHWLDAQGLYVATLNGFPYGTFHGTPVKQQVYLPDWRDSRRVDYTRRLAELLILWLPQGLTGSISTVPVVFGKDITRQEYDTVRAHLMEVLTHLAGIREEKDIFIRLSLEPEPGCYIETTAELVAFFHRLQLPEDLREHLACCYDCCHQALQFEEPEESLQLLSDNAIPIGHVQVSSALHLDGCELSSLQRFAESVYLHQAVARTANGLLRHEDLPQALEAAMGGSIEAQAWRVHFHLPVFVKEVPECGTTQNFLRRILPLFQDDVPLEVETYTWDVLPEELRQVGLRESIIREILWVEATRGA